MPYQRNYKPYSRYRPRRKPANQWKKTGRRVGGAIGTVAQAAYTGVKYLEGLINVESHFFDNQSSAVEAVSTPTVYTLAGIAQGNDNGQRTGLSILAKYINIKMNFTKNPSTVADRIRIMLVRDTHQVPDTAPTFGDVIETSSGVSYDVAPLNKLNVGRFNVLYDKVIMMDEDHVQRDVRIFRKWHKMHIRYNGTAATDVNKNGLFLMVVGGKTTPSGPTYNIHWRLKYYDN